MLRTDLRPGGHARVKSAGSRTSPAFWARIWLSALLRARMPENCVSNARQMPMECLIYRGGKIAVQESSEMLKLSSQQYAGVVASLQSAASSAGSDKRQCTRMEIQAPVRLAIMADNKVTRCVIALIRDVSLTGVGLCQAPKFVPKEAFLLSLPCEKKPMVVVC
jgi:hypothetical protein